MIEGEERERRNKREVREREDDLDFIREVIEGGKIEGGR